MANQEAHEVAEYSLLHVHMYNIYVQYIYVYACIDIMSVRLTRLRRKL